VPPPAAKAHGNDDEDLLVPQSLQHKAP
jgi:hypothetical protein